MNLKINIYSLIGLLVIVIIFWPTQHQEAGTSEAFQNSLQRHLDAISNRNLTALEPTVNENVKLIFPSGDIMDSKNDFIEFHKNWFAKGNWNWQGEIMHTVSSNSLAYGLVRYHYTEKDSVGSPSYQSEAFLLLVFEKNREGWQLIHDQNTKIPNQPSTKK